MLKNHQGEKDNSSRTKYFYFNVCPKAYENQEKMEDIWHIRMINTPNDKQYIVKVTQRR